jgi:nucleoside-diphosphate-sugar epimerase
MVRSVHRLLVLLVLMAMLQAFLVYGKNGWIGAQLIDMLKKEGVEVHAGDARLENREHVAK